MSAQTFSMGFASVTAANWVASVCLRCD